MERTRIARGLGGALIVVAVAAGCGMPPDQLPSPAESPQVEALTLALAAHGEALERARLALHRASHPLVRELACGRLQSNQAMVEWLSAEAEHHHVELLEGAEVARLSADAARALAELRARRGMGFDRAYLATEARFGAWLTERLDRALAADGGDPAARAVLDELLEMLRAQAGELRGLSGSIVGFVR